MSTAVALIIWTYLTLSLGFWAGVHWRCETCCGWTCINDPRKGRA